MRMIITTHDQWVALYNAIREECRKSEEAHVFIYASASNADSVAALRVLESLFKNDLIAHGWMPVSRYQEVADDFNKYFEEGSRAMRTAILINCGAAEDVRGLLNLYDRPNVRVVIVDSHRPICHMNNYDDPTDNVIVLLDESEGCIKEDIPPATLGSEGESDDGEGENDEENTKTPSARRRRLSNEGDYQAIVATRAEKEKKRRDIDSAIRRHYAQGVHHGKPSSCVLFDLAYHLQSDTSHALWLALIGLTDQMVHNSITQAKYTEYCSKYETHLSALGHMEERGAVEGEAGYAAAAKTGRILPRQDYRFGLLWEWNLYEAMTYSAYVAARLHTYSEKGRQLLEMLIAKMGVPLQQAQGSYLHDMKPKFRNNLHERLELHAPAFKMADVMVRSFQLQDGLQRCVMAIDAVLAVTALLECSGPPGVAAGMDDQASKFWRAYHALTWGDDKGELHRGLDLAKKVQRALITEGGSIVAQRLYHNFKAFRIYDLSDHKLVSQNMLSHPMALQRLAAFFQEQHFHLSGKRKPVVLIGPRGDDGRCLVAGYQATARMQGNRLGLAFQAATEEVGAQAWHDLFESTVIELAADDIERFKQELLRSAADLL